MSWFPALRYTLFGIFLGAEWAKKKLRIHDLRAMCARLGLSYLGDKKLPEALSLYGTPFARIDALIISNLIDGEHNGTRIIAFDCQFNDGSNQCWRTLIAARTADDVFSSATREGALTSARSSAWQILYRPHETSDDALGTMPLSEIEAIITGVNR